MKSIIEYITESILDDFDTLSKNTDKGIKQEIKQFLKDNFKGVSKCKISKNPNDDGKYVVDCKGAIEVKNKSITSLVNEYFVWGTVEGYFYCNYCQSLTSLIGAPKKVSGHFNCYSCGLLTSLIGAPKEVGWNFHCGQCKSLTSLNGAPERVGGTFNCGHCKLLTSLNGAPKEVGDDFNCAFCESLTSLQGAPKEVGGYFDCVGCKSLKSYDVDSNIKRRFLK